MQNSKHDELAYKHFVAYLREVEKGRKYSLPLDEVAIRQIVQEEIFKLLPTILPINDAVSTPSLELSPHVFTPLVNWEGSLKKKEEFYQVFIREGYIAPSKEDPLKPFIVPTDSGTVKIIWLEAIGDLIYTFYHLIHTYKVLPTFQNLKILLYKNVLFANADLVEPALANLNSYMTLYSRVVRQILAKKRIYRDIDDMLLEVFKTKKS